MSDYGWGLFKKGLKRRRKEVRRMRVMTCLAVFFLVFTLLFQDNVNELILQLNYKHHGRWVIQTDGITEQADSFFSEPVTVRIGSDIYKLYPVRGESDVVDDVEVDEHGYETIVLKPVKDENGEWLPPEDEISVTGLGEKRNTFLRLGTMPADFAERNGIELYEGRMPEKPDEIAAELEVLQKLGLSYEIGSTIEFYAAKSHAEPGEDAWEEEWEGTRIMHFGALPDSSYIIELYLVSFKLVGTVERYSSNWAGSYLPNAFITDEAFDAMDMRKAEGAFYEFKDEYVTGDVRELAQSLFGGISGREDVFPNELTYSNTLWGEPSVYKKVTALLLLMSAAVIAYLMASYLGKRRMYFLSMREIGASIKEVFAMAAYECTLSVLPFAGAALILSCVAAALLSLVVSLLMKVKYTFVFKPWTVLLIAAVCLLMLAAALLSALAVFMGRGLTEKKKTLGRFAARSIRSRAQKKNGRYLCLTESLIRSRRSHKLKTAAARLISIIVCGVTIYAVTPIFTGWYSYGVFSREPDVTGDTVAGRRGAVECVVDTELHWVRKGPRMIKSDTDTVVLSLGSDFYSMDDAVSATDLEALNDIPGIISVSMDTFDCTHYLAWEGWEEDEFVDYCAEQAAHTPRIANQAPIVYNGPHHEQMISALKRLFTRLFCYGESEYIWDAAKNYLDPDVMDREAFLRGEQIILVVDETGESVIPPSDEEQDENSPAPSGLHELSLKPGDTVWFERIGVNSEQHAVGAVVAGIVPKSSLKLSCSLEEFTKDEDPMLLFSVAGSSSLAKRIMEAEGREYGASCVKVYLDSIGLNERASGRAAKVFMDNNMSYSDNSETAKLEKDYAVEKTLTNGPFAIMLITLWAFVISSAAREERSSLAGRTEEFIRIGSEVSALKREKSRTAFLQSLWTLWTIPVYTLVSVLRCFAYVWRFDLEHKNIIIVPGEFSEDIHGMWAYFKKWTALDITRQYLAYDFNSVIQITVIITLLFCLAQWLIDRRLDIEKTDMLERSK